MAIYYGNNKVKPSGIGKAYFGNNLVYKAEQPEPAPTDQLCFECATSESASIYYGIWGSLPDIQIQYWKSGNTKWTNWTQGSGITINQGEKLWVRNLANTLSTSSSNYLNFQMSGGNIKASGNVSSMINYSDLTPWCYFYMFSDCSKLTTAPELPATELAESCYAGMFKNCSSLATAPELPATELAESCYNIMFSGCSQLKVNENGGGTKIFDCPTTMSTPSAINMFSFTGGTFKGTPTKGNSYYYE